MKLDPELSKILLTLAGIALYVANKLWLQSDATLAAVAGSLIGGGMLRRPGDVSVRALESLRPPSNPPPPPGPQP